MELSYEVIYSDGKTLSISVERDRSVVVRAPSHATEQQVQKAVEKKKLWIYQKLRHPQKYHVEVPKKEFVSGESILYLGKQYRLEVVDEEIEGVVFRGKFYIARKDQPQAAALFRAWYEQKAREKITPRAKVMAQNLGVAYNKILISDLKYRWGSCTLRDNLNFNWRLIKAPMRVIEYVVAHELAHLIEPNHTPRFWNIVSIQVPRYKEAKKWLREQGHELEVDF